MPSVTTSPSADALRRALVTAAIWALVAGGIAWGDSPSEPGDEQRVDPAEVRAKVIAIKKIEIAKLREGVMRKKIGAARAAAARLAAMHPPKHATKRAPAARPGQRVSPWIEVLPHGNQNGETQFLEPTGITAAIVPTNVRANNTAGD